MAAGILEDEALRAKLQEILEKMSEEEKRAQLPRVGISTVYNTIKMLESMGVIDTFTVEDKLRIDQPTPHINIYCRNNGKIFDADGGLLQELSEKLRGMNITVRKVLVEAICS